ncbi:MAG: zinc-ribbon domain-containing protein [Candidatus Acidiferrales bacterium]
MSEGPASPGKPGLAIRAAQPPAKLAAPVTRAVAPDLGVTGARPMIKCPKCGASARDVARFCQRCHMTLRYQCPACKHEQRTGGKCEKCGVNFLKYIAAVVAPKESAADAFHERGDRNIALAKNLIALPFTAFPLLRSLFTSRDRKKRT